MSESTQALALIAVVALKLEDGIHGRTAVFWRLKMLPQASNSLRDISVLQHWTLGDCIDSRSRTVAVCRERPHEIVAILRFITFIERECFQNDERQKVRDFYFDAILDSAVIQ